MTQKDGRGVRFCSRPSVAAAVTARWPADEDEDVEANDKNDNDDDARDWSRPSTSSRPPHCYHIAYTDEDDGY